MLPAQPANLEALRSRVFDDFVTVEHYAIALGCCERTLWNHVKQGLPLVYIGQRAYVSLTLVGEFWRSRVCKNPKPNEANGSRRPGRPRKEKLAA